MRGDKSFSHAAIIDLTDDASRADVAAGVLCRYHRSVPSARRFPPPWSVEALRASSCVTPTSRRFSELTCSGVHFVVGGVPQTLLSAFQPTQFPSGPL